MISVNRYLTLCIACFVLPLTYKSAYPSEVNASAKKQTVFLTGAAGFIGSNFLRYMFEKYPSYNFIVLDALTYAGNLENIPDSIKNSKRFEFIHDTITNQSVVDSCMKRSDLVVHFAAESHVTRSIENPEIFIDTNVVGTMVILNSLVKHKNVQRFIHIATSEVYGTAETEPMTEEHPLNPRSPYAASKAAGDRLVYAYWCTYDIPAVIIRPFNNYGPNQHPEKLIPRFITNALSGKPLTVHGDGHASRDWLHVLDTCEALDRVLHIEDFTKINHQAINLGTGISTSVYEIAQIIKKHFGLSDSDITYQYDRPGQVETHISSTDKAYKLLGWKAKRKLADSMEDLIMWYGKNENWWKPLDSMKCVEIKREHAMDITRSYMVMNGSLVEIDPLNDLY